MTTALLCGVSGQTGAYLAHTLLQKSYRVVGTSRDHSEANRWRLKRLAIDNDVEKISLSLHDTVAIRKTLSAYQPDEIFCQGMLGQPFTAKLHINDCGRPPRWTPTGLSR